MGELLEMKVNPMRLSEQLFNQALEWEPINVERAEALYQRAISVYPYNVGALLNLGTIFFRREDFFKAEQLYRQIIVINPNYALAHFNLANLLDKRWRKWEALGHYRTAVEIDPNYADAHYNLAVTLRDVGRSMESAKHWLKYLKIDPDSCWAEVARKELKKILPVIKGGKYVLAKSCF